MTNQTAESGQASSDEESVMQEIARLCDQYTKSFHGSNKVRAIHRLKEQKNTKQIITFLKSPNPDNSSGNENIWRDVSGYSYNELRNESFGETIRKNNSSWHDWYLKMFLTIVTFPITIPVLMIHSYFMRGTYDFLKTDGSILIDKITALCDSLNEEINSSPTQEEALESPIEHEPETTLHEVSEINDSVKPASSEAHTVITNDPSPINRNNNPMMKTKEPQKKNDNPSDFENHPAISMHTSNTQPGVAPFAQLNNVFSFVNDTFEDLWIQNDLKSDTGKPVITSYRLNPTNSQHDPMFSIDIKCKFRWTPSGTMRVNIPLFKWFDIPVDYQIVKNPQRLSIKKPELLEIVRSHTLTFFNCQDTTTSLLKEATKNGGIRNKERLYLKAYAAAIDDAERTQALEAAINLLSKSHKNQIEKAEDFLFEKEELPRKFDRRRYDIGEKEEYLSNRCEQITSRADGMLARINAYKANLPSNFRNNAQSALELTDKFRTIIDLVQAQHMDEAWAIYEPIPELTPFLKDMFPHLYAMDYQLKAIFYLCRTTVLHARTDKSIPGYLYGHFIPEHSIIWLSLTCFRKACELVALYDPVQHDAIVHGPIAALERLEEAGKKAEQQTSDDIRAHIRQREIWADRTLRSQGINPTYRIAGEYVDADDEAEQVDLNEVLIEVDPRGKVVGSIMNEAPLKAEDTTGDTWSHVDDSSNAPSCTC